MELVSWVVQKIWCSQEICDKEPRAVYMHYYGYSINPATCDAINQLNVYQRSLMKYAN